MSAHEGVAITPMRDHAARTHLTQALALDDPQAHRAPVGRDGLDLGVGAGSMLAQALVVHSIRGITALLGEMISLQRAAKPPEPTSSLAVRYWSLHVATKALLP